MTKRKNSCWRRWPGGGEELQAKLKTLRLGAMQHTLELRRGQAEDQRLGHVKFLALLLDDEIDLRQ